jgi:hypothetical protein
VLSLVGQCASGTILYGQTPVWLHRPGAAAEGGGLWDVVRDIYRALTGGELPPEMPARERRSVDAVLGERGGRRIVEVDERQHFTPARAVTLDHYPATVATAFDRAEWRRRCDAAGRPPGGGFATPRPPLFPEAGGRHLQRAFRDALADLLPSQHGWLPTLRIADWEVLPWLTHADARERMGGLLAAKLG